jgi:hypothetical protein
MSSGKNNTGLIAGLKDFNHLIILLLIVLVTAGCATQHKYKKKAEPCPCEKANKR